MKMKKQKQQCENTTNNGECENATDSGRTRIHNVRFYNLTPRAIQCLCYNKFIPHKLALSRNDGTIEIWDIEYAPCLERIIAKSPGDSVEGIAWAGERLFSVGLTGELVEWNLQTLRPLVKQHVTGNAIWCIDVNAEGTEMAIGTEEGYVNIFNLTDGQMQYKNLFDKQEGRVLCCKFDQTGEYLVTGSVGVIRIWDVNSGHAIHKMTLSLNAKKEQMIVWSLQVLSDFTIISGDSSGTLTVWDGRTAAFVESHQVLKTDILAVAVNEDESLLMCSGIEPIIRIYAKTKIKRDDSVIYRWVKYLQRSVHDHDVKALACAKDRILSGGMDGYLGISMMTKMKSDIAKYGPFLQNPCAIVAPKNKLLLLRYTNYLEIWRLGSSLTTNGAAETDTTATKDALNDNANQSTIRGILPLDEAPEKLLQFKSKYDEPIICATLSPDGQWLCYSTQKESRLFRFVAGVAAAKTNSKLTRMKDMPEQFCAASHLQFTHDSKQLLLANCEKKQITIFAMPTITSSSTNIASSTELDFIESIEVGKHIKDTIKLLTISQCGTYIVAAGSTDHTIAVWHIVKGKHYKHYLNLPRYSSATTALALHSQQPRLVVAFADGKIFEYDLEDMCFTCTSKYFVENPQTHCISDIVYDSRNPNVFVLHNDANLFVLEKCAVDAQADDAEEEEDEDGQKVGKKNAKKVKRIVSDNKIPGLRLKMQKSFEHLISLSWLSPNELVAVGVNPISLIEKIPGAFKQKKFGAA